MASYDYGKDEIVKYILELAPERILDVGACDGKWAKLLRAAGYEGKIDAVEAFKPSAVRIVNLYDNVFIGDVVNYFYPIDWYDVAIFGDVIEHMTVEAAQFVLEFARQSCAEVIVGVPYRYKQGAIYGNPYEVHIQDDLTPEIMAKRYPLLELLFEAEVNYAYYHFKGGAIGGRR